MWIINLLVVAISTPNLQAHNIPAHLVVVATNKDKICIEEAAGDRVCTEMQGTKSSHSLFI